MQGLGLIRLYENQDRGFSFVFVRKKEKKQAVKFVEKVTHVLRGSRWY